MTSATPQAPTTTGVIIVGAGFAGVGMAVGLLGAGRKDFVILEKASQLGGTWRDNTYPGCACDVQSHLYSFSFEPNPNWTRMFAPQGEIQSYLLHVAEKYGVRPFIHFNRAMAHARFDEGRNLWCVRTTSGETYEAPVLVAAVGGLSTPAFPTDVPGLSQFQGTMFHSQAWDHGYDLTGKRVAVLGTGASAIQFVPVIQPKVAHLTLFQRTPPWVLPKPDRPVRAWERALFRWLPWTQKLFRAAIYCRLEARVVAFVLQPRLMELARALGRAHLEAQVPDPALRARLTPDYALGCKRVLMSDTYYPAITQPNVELVTNAVTEVRAHSVLTRDGREHLVDAIILGTGFKANDPIPPGLVYGRGGVDLTTAWKDGPEAYKGTCVAGFPNLFFLVGPNVGLGHSSMIYMIESQVTYVLDALALMARDRLATLEVRAEQQRGFNDTLQGRLRRAVWNQGGCRSWYLLPNGKNVTLWPGFTFEFRRKLKHFDPAAYQATKVTAP